MRRFFAGARGFLGYAIFVIGVIVAAYIYQGDQKAERQRVEAVQERINLTQRRADVTSCEGLRDNRTTLIVVLDGTLNLLPPAPGPDDPPEDADLAEFRAFIEEQRSGLSLPLKCEKVLQISPPSN